MLRYKETRSVQAVSQAPPRPYVRTHAGRKGQPAYPRSPGTRGEGAAAASFVGQSSLRREATCSRGCGDGERLHEFVIPPRTREGNQLASPSTSARSVGKRPTTGLVCPQCPRTESSRVHRCSRARPLHSSSSLRTLNCG